MLTEILILAIVLTTLTAVGIVCALFSDGGFFAWWFVVPEVCKGFGYIVAGLFTLINEVNQ